jgi:hypothetical protein
MKCERLRELMVEALYSELSPELQAQFADHLTDKDREAVANPAKFKDFAKDRRMNNRRDYWGIAT